MIYICVFNILVSNIRLEIFCGVKGNKIKMGKGFSVGERNKFFKLLSVLNYILCMGMSTYKNSKANLQWLYL